MSKFIQQKLFLSLSPPLLFIFRNLMDPHIYPQVSIPAWLYCCAATARSIVLTCEFAITIFSEHIGTFMGLAKNDWEKL